MLTQVEGRSGPVMNRNAGLLERCGLRGPGRGVVQDQLFRAPYGPQGERSRGWWRREIARVIFAAGKQFHGVTSNRDHVRMIIEELERRIP